jgi:hypothetical protein
MLAPFFMKQSLQTFYRCERRASGWLAELATDELRWREIAYAEWLNQLPPVADHLPEPQKSWYVSGYRPRTRECVVRNSKARLAE